MSLPAVFEQYQKARTQFVQMVAELATRPQNIETLQNVGEPSLRTRVASHTRHRVTWCLRLALQVESPPALGPASPLTGTPAASSPRVPVRPSTLSSSRLPSPAALLRLLSFWGGEGWGLEDGVPKFFQSSVRAVEAFSLFSGTLGVRPRGLNFHMGPYFHVYGNQKSVG